MERHDVDADEAFQMLRRISNDRNILMRILAEQVTARSAIAGRNATRYYRAR